MIRPEAIPILEARSRVTLTPAVVEVVFGERYRWRGSERVRIVAAGRADVAVPAVAGAQLVVELDRLDADTLGTGPLRLVGPRGSVEAPEVRLVRRELVLPSGLLRAWRLEVGQRVALQAGSTIFTDVEVAEGQPAGVALGRADRVTAGLAGGEAARLRRDVEAEEQAVASDGAEVPGRLITENDVRQARLKGRRVRMRPGQKITPAALSMGRELGILDEEDR